MSGIVHYLLMKYDLSFAILKLSTKDRHLNKHEIGRVRNKEAGPMNSEEQSSRQLVLLGSVDS